MQITNNYRENIQNTNSAEYVAQTHDINKNLTMHISNDTSTLLAKIKDRRIYRGTQKQLLSYEEIQNLIFQEDETIAAQELEAKLINASYYSYEKLLYKEIETTRYSHNIYIMGYLLKYKKFILVKKLIDIMEAKYRQKASKSKTGCEWVIVKEMNIFSSLYKEKVKENKRMWRHIISTCIELQVNLHYLDAYLTAYPHQYDNLLLTAIAGNSMEALKRIIKFIKNNLAIDKSYLKKDVYSGHEKLQLYKAVQTHKNLNIVKQLIEFYYPDKIIPTKGYLNNSSVILSNNYMIIKQFIGNNTVDWSSINFFDSSLHTTTSAINSSIIQKCTESTLTIISYGGGNPSIRLEDCKVGLLYCLPPIFLAVYNKDYAIIDVLLALYGKKYSLECIQKYIKDTNFNCDDSTMKKLTLKLNNPVSLQKIASVNLAKLLISQMNKDTDFDIEDLKKRSHYLPSSWTDKINTIKDLFSLGIRESQQ